MISLSLHVSNSGVFLSNDATATKRLRVEKIAPGLPRIAWGSVSQLGLRIPRVFQDGLVNQMT